MSVSVNDIITYSQVINTMQLHLLSLPSNLDTYSTGVPEYLKYPYIDSEAIPVQTGYTPTIKWENSAVASVVSTSDFVYDFTSFINNQMLSLGIHQHDIVNAPLLIKLLTAMYCYITSRFIVVYHPRYSGASVFVNLTLSPTIDTTNEVDLPVITFSGGDVEYIITAICNQAKSGIRSVMVTNDFTYAI